MHVSHNCVALVQQYIIEQSVAVAVLLGQREAADSTHAPVSLSEPACVVWCGVVWCLACGAQQQQQWSAGGRK